MGSRRTEESNPGTPFVDRRKGGSGRPPEGHVVDRRMGLDGRRDDETGLERKRGPGRRLSDFTRAAEEGEMTQEQFMFLVAIDEFKKVNDRPFPTWSDVLEVIRLLGYRKTMASELHLTRAEDWTERPDAEANVRPDNWHDRPESPRKRRERGEAERMEFEAYDLDLDDLEDLADAA